MRDVRRNGRAMAAAIEELRQRYGWTLCEIAALPYRMVLLLLRGKERS